MKRILIVLLAIISLSKCNQLAEVIKSVYSLEDRKFPENYEKYMSDLVTKFERFQVKKAKNIDIHFNPFKRFSKLYKILRRVCHPGYYEGAQEYEVVVDTINESTLSIVAGYDHKQYCNYAVIKITTTGNNLINNSSPSKDTETLKEETNIFKRILKAQQYKDISEKIANTKELQEEI